MSADFNPYQAPDAPVAEDFIAVEPRRRPTSNFVAAATCFGGAAFVLGIEVIFLLMTIDKWSRAGTRWENHPARLGWGEIVLVPIGCSALLFLFSGRSFWRMRDRRGVLLFLAAIVAFASIFLIPWLFP